MVSKSIRVEVAYALPDKQLIIPLSVSEGTSMYDAAVLSGIAAKFPGLDLDTSDMGIFGKIEKDAKTAILREGDRVEIYRPLIADPKEVRKKRAAQVKAEREHFE
jgi:uncharacterized protein